MISSELGYILGALAGDGFISEYSIGMNVKDKDFALYFKETFEKEFRKEGKLHFYNNLWRIIFHNKKLAKMLKEFDIYNSIKNSSREAKCAFLKGFYDSEGSAYLRIVRVSKPNKSRADRKIELCNTNLKLLVMCKTLLQEVGIKTLKIERRFRKERELKGRKLNPTTFYRFHLSEGKENFKVFRDLIGFSIARKQKALEGMISSYLIPNRNKWLIFKEDAIKSKRTKRYSEIRKELYFIPKGVIDRWLYR